MNLAIKARLAQLSKYPINVGRVGEGHWRLPIKYIGIVNGIRYIFGAGRSGRTAMVFGKIK